MELNIIMVMELYPFSKVCLEINVQMLNFFPFINVHYKVGEMFSDWIKELVSEGQKVAIRIQKNSLKFFLRKK